MCDTVHCGGLLCGASKLSLDSVFRYPYKGYSSLWLYGYVKTIPYS